MRHDERLSPAQIAGWGGLGLLTGLVVGLALSAWAGDVNRERIGRATERIRRSGPTPMPTRGAAARGARSTLSASPALRGLPIEVRAIAPGVIELRGWVASRSQRALAARTVRASGGVDRVINSILVRGEDDRTIEGARPGDQSA
ncbi:MAG TPA: BON domain-containing protein [Gemmatimonadales bacterium]